MHRGQPAEVNVVSEGEGHVGIGSGKGRQKNIVKKFVQIDISYGEHILGVTDFSHTSN